jgi:hypothetical protein
MCYLGQYCLIRGDVTTHQVGHKSRSEDSWPNALSAVLDENALGVFCPLWGSGKQEAVIRVPLQQRDPLASDEGMPGGS